MPFYEYRCVKGHTFEMRQSMSDEPVTTCEVCGAEASRVLFAPAIHFKGSGFHNTDYGSKRRGGGDDGGTGAGGSADSGANGAGTSDSGSGASTSDSGASSGTASESSGGSSTTVGLDKV